MEHKKRGCAFYLVVMLVIAVILFVVVTQYRERIITYFFPLDYREYVEAYAQEYDLDPWLIFAVIREESSFKADAVSRAGAMGLMQLMPKTAAWIIEQAGFEMSDILEPTHNIRLGCWYIDWLRDYYDGDLIAALAAYNAGMSNVNQWLAKGVWDGTLEQVADIPFSETRRYISYVWESYDMYRYLYEK